MSQLIALFEFPFSFVVSMCGNLYNSLRMFERNTNNGMGRKEKHFVKMAGSDFVDKKQETLK